MKNVTYILLCADNTFYTGWTNDIKKRLRQHQEGRGAKYTRGRTPVKLVYLEISKTKHDAMSREAYIKKMTRKEKEKLIENCMWRKKIHQEAAELEELFGLDSN